MQPDTSIFLVGPMGSGKSAVGKRLARELGREFIDSDHLIEARSGVDIPFIFEREGEAGFRERECRVIDEVTPAARYRAGHRWRVCPEPRQPGQAA